MENTLAVFAWSQPTPPAAPPTCTSEDHSPPMTPLRRSVPRCL